MTVTSNGVLCGKCKAYHPTVADVKACYLGTGPVAQAPANSPAGSTTAPLSANVWRKGNDGTWLVQVANGAATGDTVVVAKRSGEVADVVLGEYVADGIDGVKFFRPEAKPVPTPATDLPDVPEGYYAVASATGNNDLDFYVVQVGKDKWAGRIFVKRVIGGHPDTAVRGTEAKAALTRIFEADWQEAAHRYGQEIGRCGKCNRTLTDETSRAYGIGPVCRDAGW